MNDIQLSDDFWLSELIKSETALRNNIDNYPKDPAIIEALRLVAQKILQPCRNEFGPIKPNSGYRCPTVNVLVGSYATHSQHLLGQAVDFEVAGIPNYNLAIWIQNNIPIYDQLILECYTEGELYSGWVHCSIKDSNNRKQSLTYHNGEYREGLIK